MDGKNQSHNTKYYFDLYGGGTTRVKWNGKTFDVPNESKSKTGFEATWNDYSISVSRDDWLKRAYKKTQYDTWCYDPKGGCLVGGAAYSTIQAAVQDCFDNIDYPLVSINDPDDDFEPNSMDE